MQAGDTGGRPVADSNPWTPYVTAYLAQRRARRSLSFASRQQYRYRLDGLTAALARVPLRAATGEVLDAVDAHLARQTWSPATTATWLGTVRPFLTWAARRGLLDVGVVVDLHNPRRAEPLPRAQPPAAVETLLERVPDHRGRVIVLLMAQCGLRRAEVARLDLRHVDFTHLSILVHGKGDKQRVVYPSPETMDAIATWLNHRGWKPGALICHADHPGRPLTPNWIGILVVRWMDAAGLKTGPGDGVSGHALRHTAATQLLRGGANIRVVQAAMGHASIMTTARYLRADDDEVRAAQAALSFAAARRLKLVPGDGA